jgi:hypothetical protein
MGELDGCVLTAGTVRARCLVLLLVEEGEVGTWSPLEDTDGESECCCVNERSCSV